MTYKEKLKLQINVYGANWCSDCKRTKKYLGEQRIHYNWYDIEKSGQEKEKALQFVYKANEKIFGKAKRKIPVVEVVKDDVTKIFVEPSNYELAEYLGIATKAKKDFYHVIIIGAGPSGLTASIYLARDGYDVLVVERSTIGGQTFITNRLDNFPGFPTGITGSDFAENIKRQAERFGVEIISPQNVRVITPCHLNGTYDECKFKIVQLDNGQKFSCIAVLMATGSEYRQLAVPGHDTLLGVNVHYCATCDGYFYKDKDVFVVGGGNSAFEEALFLKEKFARKVTILVRGNKPRASPVLQEKIADREEIDVWLNSEIVELIGDVKLDSVKIRHTDKDEIKESNPDGIFIFIGLSPNTKFLNDVNLNLNGFILTESDFQSSAKGIFAAGDCRFGSTKQAVAAAGEGAAAAIMIRDFLSKN